MKRAFSKHSATPLHFGATPLHFGATPLHLANTPQGSARPQETGPCLPLGLSFRVGLLPPGHAWQTSAGPVTPRTNIDKIIYTQNADLRFGFKSSFYMSGEPLRSYRQFEGSPPNCSRPLRRAFCWVSPPTFLCCHRFK